MESGVQDDWTPFGLRERGGSRPRPVLFERRYFFLGPRGPDPRLSPISALEERLNARAATHRLAVRLAGVFDGQTRLGNLLQF
jgi:hypothetical protein